MNMKRFIKTGITTLFLVLFMSFTAFAGEWKQNETGWWYSEDDGTYPTSSWRWIDGNKDGIAECYYFDPSGYMAVNKEIEGYTVNIDGAWVVDGIVQTQGTAQQSANDTQSDMFNYEDERLEEAREALREAGMTSFYEDNYTERKEALYGYLQALGYNTSLLKFSKTSYTYGGGISWGTDPLWSLMSANDGEVRNLIKYYVCLVYTWAKDKDGEFYEMRLMVHGLEDEGDDGYATNLINAIESQLY